MSCPSWCWRPANQRLRKDSEGLELFITDEFASGNLEAYRDSFEPVRHALLHPNIGEHKVGVYDFYSGVTYQHATTRTPLTYVPIKELYPTTPEGVMRHFEEAYLRQKTNLLSKLAHVNFGCHEDTNEN